MPGNKDPKQRQAIKKKSEEKIFEKRMNLCIRRDWNMWEPMQKAAQDTNQSVQQYVLTTVRAALIASGYMSDTQPQTEE